MNEVNLLYFDYQAAINPIENYIPEYSTNNCLMMPVMAILHNMFVMCKDILLSYLSGFFPTLDNLEDAIFR